MAQDPLIVHTTRGGVVELESRGNAVVVDSDGSITEAFGTVDRRLPLRSTARPRQAGSAGNAAEGTGAGEAGSGGRARWPPDRTPPGFGEPQRRRRPRRA